MFSRKIFSSSLKSKRTCLVVVQKCDRSTVKRGKVRCYFRCALAIRDKQAIDDREILRRPARRKLQSAP